MECICVCTKVNPQTQNPKFYLTWHGGLSPECKRSNHCWSHRFCCAVPPNFNPTIDKAIWLTTAAETSVPAIAKMHSLGQCNPLIRFQPQPRLGEHDVKLFIIRYWIRGFVIVCSWCSGTVHRLLYLFRQFSGRWS